MLDHNSIVPLYEQLIETIRQDILRGHLKPKQKLPAEGKLAEQYGVSIIVIRRAISELVKEGLVEKKQGKGTFVTAPHYFKSFGNRAMSFTETCAANGLAAGAKVLKLGYEVPDAENLKMLQLPDGTKAVRILRLRLASSVPCVIEDNFFPPQFDYLLSENWEDKSIYHYLRAEKGIEIVPGKLTLKIVRADANTAKLLQISRNTPLLKMIGVSYQKTGEILHTCTQIGYGENFDYIVR